MQLGRSGCRVTDRVGVNDISRYYATEFFNDYKLYIYIYVAIFHNIKQPTE